jgi:hypothetical protein
MTTRTLFVITLVAAAALAAIGLWTAAEAPSQGIALILAAPIIAGWGAGAYRRQIWAWRAAVAFCWLLFFAAAASLLALPAAYVLNVGAKGNVLLLVVAGAGIALMAYTASFWGALKCLRRERGMFESSLALERTLGAEANPNRQVARRATTAPVKSNRPDAIDTRIEPLLRP